MERPCSQPRSRSPRTPRKSLVAAPWLALAVSILAAGQARAEVDIGSLEVRGRVYLRAGAESREGERPGFAYSVASARAEVRHTWRFLRTELAAIPRRRATSRSNSVPSKAIAFSVHSMRGLRGRQNGSMLRRLRRSCRHHAVDAC